MKSHLLRARQKGLVLVETAFGSAASAVSTYTVNIPSATRQGDLIVVASGMVSTADRAMSTTTGYTELFELYASDDNDSNLSVAWRIADGSETTVTVSGNNVDSPDCAAACVIHVWRNADQTTPIDVTSTTATATNTGVPDPPSITPVTSGAVVLGVGFSPANAILTAPSGTAHSVATRGLAAGKDCAIIMCAYKSWTSGAYNMAAFGGASTTNTLSSAAAAIVIRPAFPGSVPV